MHGFLRAGRVGKRDATLGEAVFSRFFVKRKFCVTCLIFAFVLIFAGCVDEGGFNENKTDDKNREFVSSTATFRPDEGFWTESQGIGGSWFTYVSGLKHGLAPKSLIYVIQKQDNDGTKNQQTCNLKGDLSDALFLRFISYTNNNQDEGYLSFEIEQLGVFRKRFQTPVSVMEKPVCFDFSEALKGKRDNLFFSCEDYQQREGFLIFTAPERPMLNWVGRFEVPTVQLAGQSGYRIGVIKAKKTAEIRSTTSCEFVPDVNFDIRESRLSSALDGIMQITVDREFKAVAWRFNDRNSIIDYKCGNATITDSFRDSKQRTLDFAPFLEKIPAGEMSVFKVSLCGSNGDMSDVIVEKVVNDFSKKRADYTDWVLYRGMSAYDRQSFPTFFLFVTSHGIERLQLPPGVISMSQNFSKRGISSLVEDETSSFRTLDSLDLTNLEIPFVFQK